ncbi:Spindle assembly abnormal protein 6 [Nowakowskiella sp. JEL0407]|nr:Spindle assembly abnormal protein 6 [Nowakowskiella sp. JEL0407]KAJ3125045.1 Spindle assembly abnormal protein 6 [Nowakowskiella sp. JEL0407]
MPTKTSEIGTDQLFSKQVPVILKHTTNTASANPNSINQLQNLNRAVSPSLTGELKPLSLNANIDCEKRLPGITVQLCLSTKNSGRLKVLEIQLTDESDPFFLYQLDIGEEEFHALRYEQNLLVDFQQFPVKLVELLEECIACKNDDSPKFIAQLVSDSQSHIAVFSIIETNTFKHITHLSLRFVPGNDSSVKQYLANLVKEFKLENHRLQNQLSNTSTSLSTRLKDAESTVSQLSFEIEKLKTKHAEQFSKLQLQHADELSREKERNIREIESEIRKSEREKHELEIKCEEKIKSLTQKNTSLNTTQSHLTSRINSLEDSLESANRQIDVLTHTLNSTKNELERMNTNYKNQERKKDELERECFASRDRLKEYEQKEKELEEQRKRTNEMFVSVKDQKAGIEETLEVYKTQCMRLEESLKSATDEINKGNEIIRKLQTDLKTIKSKVKLKNVVTLQQEKLLDERASAIDSYQKDIANFKEQLYKKQTDCDALNSKVEDLTKKLEESKKTIDDNNHVIEWLHKQLNEDAINRPLASLGLGALEADGKFASSNDPKKQSPPYRSRYVTDIQSQGRSSALGVTSTSPTRRTANTSPVRPTTAGSTYQGYQSAYVANVGNQGILNSQKIGDYKPQSKTFSSSISKTAGLTQTKIPTGNLESKRSAYFQQ